jgi:hypothetical protein
VTSGWPILLAMLAATETAAPRFGDPIPLSRREPTLAQFALEADLHFGLVGSGPTQLTNDLRVGLFDWWELRTSLAPYPASLLSRFKLGSTSAPWGALVLDAGLAYFDAGLRLFPEADELPVGLRFHLEGGLSYSRALGRSVALQAAIRWRHRASTLSHDDQGVLGADASVSWDVMRDFSLTGGVALGQVIYGETRELTIQFVEAGRPGLSQFLIRTDQIGRSLTLPLSITYSLVDTFDVDVFVTPRVHPQFDVLFGAGLRVRVLDLTTLAPRS